MTHPVTAPPGWYPDPADVRQQRWWSGQSWTQHVAPAPIAPGRQHPGVPGAAIIVGATFALWLFAACAELFWYDEHGSRLTIVALAALPAGAALLWIMARRLRAADRMSPWTLVLIAVLGGFVALIIPSLVEPPWSRWWEAMDLRAIAPIIAGPLEETVKLAVVVIAARWLTVRTARTGLFVGAAVGAGYAVFENIDYAVSATARLPFVSSQFEHLGVMLRVAVERDVFTAFAHPLWTALAAAALFAGSRGGRIRISRLAIGGWVVAVVLHSLWDDVPSLLAHSLAAFPALSFVIEIGWGVALSAVGFFIWRAVARRANRSALAAEEEIPIAA